MLKIKVAGLRIQIENRFDFVAKQCKDYLCNDLESADFIISVNDDEFEQQRMCNPGFSDGYIESVCFCRSVALILPQYDAMLLHGAALEYRGRAFVFCAKSGVGKSTHIGFVQDILGDGCRIINGDKPILRISDGKIYACGSPWCGKERMQNNISAKISGLFLIYRADEYSAYDINPVDSVNFMMNQIILPENPSDSVLTLDLLDKLISSVRLVRLNCTLNPLSANNTCQIMDDIVDREVKLRED